MQMRMSLKSELEDTVVIIFLMVLLALSIGYLVKLMQLPEEAWTAAETAEREMPDDYSNDEEFGNKVLSMMSDSEVETLPHDSLGTQIRDSSGLDVAGDMGKQSEREENQETQVLSDREMKNDQPARTPQVIAERKIIPMPNSRKVKRFRDRSTEAYIRSSKGEANKVEVNFVLEAGRRYQRNEEYFVRFIIERTDLEIEVYFLDDADNFSLEKYEYILNSIYGALEVYLNIQYDSFTDMSYKFSGNSRIYSTEPSADEDRSRDMVKQIGDFWTEYASSYTGIGRINPPSYQYNILLEDVYDQSKIESTFTIRAFSVFSDEE